MAYVTSGEKSTSFAASISDTVNLGTNADRAIMVVAYCWGNVTDNPTTATIGGVSMTNSSVFSDSAGYGYMAFHLSGGTVPSGSQTLTVNFDNTTGVCKPMMAWIVWDGVSSLSAATTNTGQNTTPSVTVSTTSGNVVAGVMQVPGANTVTFNSTTPTTTERLNTLSSGASGTRCAAADRSANSSSIAIGATTNTPAPSWGIAGWDMTLASAGGIKKYTPQMTGGFRDLAGGMT